LRDQGCRQTGISNRRRSSGSLEAILWNSGLACQKV
jgi:hypothetical protein